jgi:adenylate cyclase
VSQPARQRVLVVDDTPHNIKLLEAVLLPRGYAVIPATPGPEALAKVATEPPDLILCDVVMLGLDGYEVCRRLRADPATRLLPVVMVTASGEQEKIKAIEAGADDFLMKPFNQAELLARVKSLIRIKEYHDTIQAQAAELAAAQPPMKTGDASTSCPDGLAVFIPLWCPGGAWSLHWMTSVAW